MILCNNLSRTTDFGCNQKQIGYQLFWNWLGLVRGRVRFLKIYMGEMERKMFGKHWNRPTNSLRIVFETHKNVYPKFSLQILIIFVKIMSNRKFIYLFFFYTFKRTAVSKWYRTGCSRIWREIKWKKKEAQSLNLVRFFFIEKHFCTRNLDTL